MCNPSPDGANLASCEADCYTIYISQIKSACAQSLGFRAGFRNYFLSDGKWWSSMGKPSALGQGALPMDHMATEKHPPPPPRPTHPLMRHGPKWRATAVAMDGHVD